MARAVGQSLRERNRVPRRKIGAWQLGALRLQAVLMNPTSLLPILGSLCLLASGCVLGQRTVALPVPSHGSGGSKGQVAITSITDARVFQNKPSDPSTPSARGDVNQLSAQQRANLIGRQRNTYGAAMGDIALPAGETAATKMRELIASALAKRGYGVGGSGGNSASVRIDEFWAWGTPGMWSIGFEARVRGQFTVRRGGATRTFSITGHGENNGQVASDTNWRQAYERAFADFLAKLDTELAGAGF